jgi:endonuclease YncB( thermonuclease family)
MVAKVFSPNGSTSAAGWCRRGWRTGGYSTDYVDAEDEARKAKRGMWRGSFMKPWVWRASSQGTQALSRVVPMSGPRR